MERIMSDSDYVTIQVRFPKTVLAKLRQAMTVRFVSTEGAGVIEAFLACVLEQVQEGGGTKTFNSGSITTRVLP